jgi:hypothetical protein
MILRASQRLRAFGILVLVDVVCAALGFWVQYRVVASAISHQPEAAGALRSLLGAAVIGWCWTSALVSIAVYLILSKIDDGLREQRKRFEAESLRRIESLVRTRDAVIFSLASLTESRDEVTGRHVERVSFYASRLAAAAAGHPKFRHAITPQFIQLISIAAMLHDIGKVGIEDAILLKPGRLTDAERVSMQRHSRLGGRHLADIEQRLGSCDVIRMARDIARWHHERWDGTGYPDGLAGEAIPLAARIAAVADVYEALTSLRHYKPPFSHRRSVEIIRHEAGKQFDPDMVDVFLQIESLCETFAFKFREDHLRGSARPAAGEAAGEPAPHVEPVVAGNARDQEWAVHPLPQYLR